MMNLLHTFAALLTVVLFLVRRRCVKARVCQTKRSSFEPLCPYEGSQTSMRVPRPAESWMFWARNAANAITTSCSLPKHKRDPDILIDDKHMGVSPSG